MELSVVIPVYNEASALRELTERLRAAVGDEAELLFVDDGSTDDTASVLAALAASDSALRVLTLRRNHGKSQALAVGFRRARGDVVAMIDGDLQDEPAEISRLTTKLEEGFDVVSGWRKERADSGLKRLVSRLFNVLVSIAGGLRLHDVNCGLKVFRREVIEDMPLGSGFHRFLPLLAHWRGYRVSEVEVKHHPRRHGRSRYGVTRGLRALMDLVVILFLVRHEGRPGRYFVGLGALFVMAGLAISLFILQIWLANGNIQSRHPLMALGLVLLVVGVQVGSLGLFGELLAYHFRSRVHLEPVVTETGSSAGDGSPNGAGSLKGADSLKGDSA